MAYVWFLLFVLVAVSGVRCIFVRDGALCFLQVHSFCNQSSSLSTLVTAPGSALRARREMRLAPTSSEQVLWQSAAVGLVCSFGVRSCWAAGPVHRCFFAAEVKLVVEVDGGYHDQLRERSKKRRDRCLQGHG
jgi:very-short-patch-repair endonuclease